MCEPVEKLNCDHKRGWRSEPSLEEAFYNLNMCLVFEFGISVIISTLYQTEQTNAVRDKRTL
jgi:hypothetical protein